MRLLIRQFILLALISQSIQWQHSFTQNEKSSCSESCFTTDVSAYQTVKTPIWMSNSPIDSFSRSKFSAVNGSAWEQWYFDLVSESAKAAVAISLSRDPSYVLFGNGILRVELILAWENGTHLTQTDFVEDSRVQDCCGEVFGLWKSSDRSYSFHVSKHLDEASVYIDIPLVKGHFNVKSFSPARYADGSTWPSTSASSEASPQFHFTETIPAGQADVQFDILGGDSLTFSGLGGHNHIWAAQDWFSVVREWHAIRAVVGPYSLSLFEDVSNIDGITYQGTILVENGKRIFSSRHRGEIFSNTTEDHVNIVRRFGGTLHSGIGDVSTGWTLEFISPGGGRSWSFDFEHQNVAFEMGLGGGKGLVAFTDIVSGGEVLGERYDGGYGLGEQVFLPSKVSLALMVKIWWAHITSTNTSIPKAMWLTLSSFFR